MSIARPFPSSGLLSQRGCPCPSSHFPPPPGPWGLGLPGCCLWKRALSVKFIFKVGETTDKWRERPELGVHARQGEGYVETPLERNSSKACSLQVSRFGALPHFFQSFRFAGLRDHCLSCLAASRHAPLWARFFSLASLCDSGSSISVSRPPPKLKAHLPSLKENFKGRG